ncbi:MAG: helix-turn-helix transcriptional regulator [Actinomycetota bacterium]
MSDRGPKPTERGVYVISVVADLSGMHPQTLRMYERRGLIEPKRTTGNSRRYSQQDVERLKRIQELTQRDGLNLAGVRIVMDLETKVERLQSKVEKLSRQLAETEQRLELEKRRRSRPRGVLVRMSDVASIFEDLEAGTKRK